ncbi:MAG: hypothetical protein JRJ21_00140 [Deltaproteobacteria bacterium]|nr:hypothetical protein [Deltaproteobacteria bacterium]MBW2614683.1 hypothetical protein [Deltaproteobacteria bacterium]
MIIVPKEKPAVENLNSYYLDIRKLIEHYQGEVGSGCVHFKASSAEGVVFFDKDDLLNGFFRDSKGEAQGKTVIDRLVEAAVGHNFAISIYEINAEKVYFWANIPAADKIYEDLSAEFTDLEGLIKKMGSEKLTGFIDVSIGEGNEGGLIFFDDGEIIGNSFSWGKGELNRSKESQEILIQKTKELGGIFHVSRISLKKEGGVLESEDLDQKGMPDVLTMLESLLSVFERVITSDREIESDFNTLLKKKFVEKADDFVFLDPFAAEFKYADQKVTFTGDAGDEELVKGLTECVNEIAEGLGILAQVKAELGPWSEKYGKELEKFHVSF